jgi:hypothetical protein
MPRRPDWRSPSNYDYLEQLDRAGMAWEFLRRNREYRKDFVRILDATVREAAAIAQRWGLSFRLRP